MSKQWYSLDTAGKIFPVNYTNKEANSYRVSVIMKEDVDKDILFKATKEALKRFSPLCVKLRKGFFWDYLEHNDNDPIIEEESCNIVRDVTLKSKNEFLFQVSYYGRRISIDMFHAITDGNGTLEFLKTIVYFYCQFKGYEVHNDGSIITDEVEESISEGFDDFNNNFKKNKVVKAPYERAFHYPGKLKKDNWNSIYHYLMNCDQVRDVAKKYNTTVTGLFSAIIMQATYNVYFKEQKQKYNCKLFIAINARKFFESISLRNFMLTVRTDGDLRRPNLKFDDFIGFANDTLATINKETLEEKIANLVSIEKILILRLCPFFIKDIALKIGFYAGGSDQTTISVSNMGIVKIDPIFKNYIERFDFVIGGTKVAPINMACISYENTCSLTFCNILVDNMMIKEITRLLSSLELDVTLEVNDTEGI